MRVCASQCCDTDDRTRIFSTSSSAGRTVGRPGERSCKTPGELTVYTAGQAHLDFRPKKSPTLGGDNSVEIRGGSLPPGPGLNPRRRRLSIDQQMTYDVEHPSEMTAALQIRQN